MLTALNQTTLDVVCLTAMPLIPLVGVAILATVARVYGMVR